MCGVVQCVPWLLAADPRRWRQEPPGSAFQGWSPGTSSWRFHWLKSIPIAPIACKWQQRLGDEKQDQRSDPQNPENVQNSVRQWHELSED